MALSNKTRWTASVLETSQWFVFLLASSVAMPIVIGSIFQMNFAEVSGLMQRTFFVVGVASLLQALFGHRLPIMEGPAGIWVSIFAVMAATGFQSGASYPETLRVLETTMIFTGVILFLIGIFKVTEKILPIFTPLVTGMFFFLLTVQLSGAFLKGMLGIQGSSNAIQLIDAIISFATFFVVLGLSAFGRGWLSNYAVIIGIVFGWIAHVLFVGEQVAIKSSAIFSLPTWFAFGVPRIDASIFPIAFITAIISISNIVASIMAVNQTLGLGAQTGSEQVNRGTSLSGINHGLAGLFSSIANVPLATSAGFIALTGKKRKRPFIYATLALIFIAFFPPIVAFFSNIPGPIANAALMASFIQLVGLAIRNITAAPLDARKGTIVGVAYLIGMGTMFLPTEVFSNFPPLVQNVASNGLFVGVILVILLEQLWRERA